MPSSGTHWVRLMLARGLVTSFALPDEIDSIRVEHLIPTFRDKAARFKYNDRADIPRIQHSHAPYSWIFRKRRVIVQIRDLRDALVSHYKVLSTQQKYGGSFKEFLRGVKLDERYHNSLRTRVQFLNSWGKGAKHTEAFLVVRYEDLKMDTADQVRRILEFVRLPRVNDQMIADVVEFGSIENMRRLERRNPLPQYKGGVWKVGEGLSGSFRNFFEESDLQYFRDYISEHLAYDFGYDYLG
jgi:hypothetical protein